MRSNSKNNVMRKHLLTPLSVQGATPQPEFENMRYTIHQIMTKIFQFVQKKLGITAGFSISSMEVLKQMC